MPVKVNVLAIPAIKDAENMIEIIIHIPVIILPQKVIGALSP